ncbi:MAG: rRNA maturation RNase YbeY [Cytophagales bacterium]
MFCMSIYFFHEGVDFRLESPDKTSAWLDQVVAREGYAIDEINYIFCDDRYLHQLNKKHLQHDTLTDIITFDHRLEGSDKLLADIYISVVRVREHAKIFDVTFTEELARVMVHGILHLLGYDDTTPVLKDEMRRLEDFYLA